MTQFAKETLPISLEEEMRRSYLDYAMSVIVGRALPDARDGLKPVHRRVLFAMHELNNDWNRPYKKSARIVGDVIGKYHPHGDQSVYDTIVRLAQDFSMRHMLVDGQGNFGSVDGDNAAAMRYTEIRLAKIAHEMLADIDKETVDFGPNYDESEHEPLVMPARFPNLLVNGAAGIAVGMATNIPPHNLDELISGCQALLADPALSDEALVALIPGPDFPTGGVIVEPRDSILDAYRTGRGSFRTRAKWEVEDLGRGTWQIVVTEIPFQVAKSKLIEKLAELIQVKKVPLLADVRDESAEDIRLILEPRARTVEPEVLMGSLFKNSDLETRFSLNMNVLIDGKVPRVCSLKDVLRAFLDHRRDVLCRRSQHRIEKIDTRLEVLEGLLIAFLNLDRVIDIIRYDDDPKAALMAEDWSKSHIRATSEKDYLPPAKRQGSLTDNPAEAILNMRLRALRKLEEIEIKREHKELSEEKREIEALLASTGRQWTEVKRQLKNAREIFDPAKKLGKRRSNFDVAKEIDTEAALEALIVKEPVTVVLSEKGWIRALKGHNQKLDDLKFKEGDELALTLECQTTDKVVLMASGGRAFTLGADKLPGGRGHGEPIRIIVDMENDQSIVTAFVHDPKRRLLLASHEGYGFVVPEAEVFANTRKGKQVMNVKSPDEAQLCLTVEGDHVAIVGENRKLLVFALSEIPEMVRGKGVRLQRYKDGGVLDAKLFSMNTGLTWQDSADRTFTRSREELVEWIGNRAAAGRMVPKGFPRTGKFGG